MYKHFLYICVCVCVCCKKKTERKIHINGQENLSKILIKCSDAFRPTNEMIQDMKLRKLDNYIQRSKRIGSLYLMGLINFFIHVYAFFLLFSFCNISVWLNFISYSNTYIYIYTRGVMVIVVGNGHGEFKS